jgi:integrase/recombinase XerD
MGRLLAATLLNQRQTPNPLNMQDLGSGGTKVTISEAVETFLGGYFSTCRRSAKTYAAYKIDLKQMQEFIKTEELTGITAEALEQWARDLQARKYTSASIRRKFATAKVFFSYWVRKRVIESSPLWRIRLDLGRERILPRSLTPVDAKALIESTWKGIDFTDINGRPSDPKFLLLRNLAAIEVLFATGMRVGELVLLNLGDWTEQDASFLINGKGARQRLGFLPDDRSLSAVKKYIEVRQRVLPASGALFLNASGKRISTQGIARMIGQEAEGAGIAVRLTPHMIRHTVATLLLRFGTDIRVVQEVLGHASIATTQRYTHVSKEHMLSTLRARHPSHHLSINMTEQKAS